MTGISEGTVFSRHSRAFLAALFLTPAALSMTMTTTANAEPYAKNISATAEGPIAYRVVNVRGSDTLNLRAWPSTRSRVLVRIPFNGRRLFNEGRKVRDWVLVSYRGREGWVHSDFIAAETYGRSLLRVTGVKRYDDLNIRLRASAVAPIVGSIPSDGEGIRARGRCEDGFCPVQYGVMKGWVRQKFVEVQADGRAHRSTWAERRQYNMRRWMRWSQVFRDRFDRY